MQIRDKTILITGASRGIGLACAREFNEQGATVLLANRKPNDELKSHFKFPEKVELIQADMSSHESIESLAQFVQKRGPLDMLFNNAGQLTGGPLEEQPVEKILSMYQVNLVGTIHLTRLLLPTLLKRPEAKVVFNASVSGVMSLPCASTYASSKNALVVLARSLQIELKETNVAGDAAIAISKLGDGTVSDIEFSYLDGVTSSIQTQLDAKEGTITGGTASQYWSGEKSWETLNTDAVVEASNLYFTDQRALDATVDDAIVDAEVDRAPSQNAVFDALTLKADASSLSSNVLKGGDTMTGALNLPANGLNVGSTQLVVNGGNVGVGTGSPSEKLTVSGNMTAWGKIEADYNGTEDAFHAHQEGTGNIASFSQGAGWDQKMVLTNNGNVGIGTTSPQRKLHTGNAGPNDILLENTADSSSLHLRTDGSGNAFANNMNDLVSNGTTGNALLTVTGQDGIRFNYGNASSSGTETMRIDNTGNVGIGTATPSSKLEVTGDIKVTGRVIQSSSPASSLPVNLTGLAGYWNFQEGAAVDHSGNGNAGDLRDADIANADGDTPPYILESRSSKVLCEVW